MKIAHLCLSIPYTDGMSYQENELIRSHVAAGHDVLVLSSTEKVSPDGFLYYVDTCAYHGEDGAFVRRLPYRKWLPRKVMRKLRMYSHVHAALQEFRPDAILFHGASAWDVRTVARYVRENPGTTFYIDSHSDDNNSARTFTSREVLHKLYYGPVLRSVASDAKAILCISTEAMEFAKTVYRLPLEKLQFFPLGGNPLSDAEYEARRHSTRTRLGLRDGETMLLQSGKQTRRKKLLEALDALSQTPDPRLRLFVAGSLCEDIREQAEAKIAADSRVQFLGWQPRDEMINLLCASDVYLQPGTQSVTMQQSLCCRCAVILDDVPAHQVYKLDNGWFVSDSLGLERAFAEISQSDLGRMQMNSFNLAREILDYRVLAERVLK